MIHVPLGRKTGPKPKFSAADVIDAVLEIGLDRFTMAQVAKRWELVLPACIESMNLVKIWWGSAWRRSLGVSRGFLRSILRGQTCYGFGLITAGSCVKSILGLL